MAVGNVTLRIYKSRCKSSKSVSLLDHGGLDLLLLLLLLMQVQ